MILIDDQGMVQQQIQQHGSVLEKLFFSKIIWKLSTPSTLSGEELYNIFVLQLQRYHLQLESKSQFSSAWFHEHTGQLPYRGTCIELWIQKALILHCQHVFHSAKKHIITDNCLNQAWFEYLNE
jgi:hypothetical protein